LSGVLYMGRFALIVAALLLATSIGFSSFSKTQIVIPLTNNNGYKAYGSSLSDFNFAAAGDWECNSRTEDTVDNIVSKNPELVLGLGDYSYDDTADCWLEIIAPLDEKMKIALANHDVVTTSLLNQYMDHFNLTKQFYSFNYQNVHFTVISTVLLRGSEGAEQYEFVNADLASAASDPNIDWIVVLYHTEAYTSPWVGVPNGHNIHTGLNRLKDRYHPLFEKYDVDLVLQADNHNYQRSYPLKYNNANTSAPIITNANTHNYSNPEGQIFVTVGTGGADTHFFLAKEPYMVYHYTGFGFLNVDVIDNGHTFNATFYSNDGDSKDQFTITKNSSSSVVT
jgi:calcineurin-like phosphoesterase family protein